ncbi:MAG: hypothetical protein AUI14_02320 [Actinobacteria bacterium 13_2_20CM_2_71_6]|nr:MAG: hypothetical protein AUI14_02320 [Actinobacteria bacterium 13_2_20CM_2_71_6]
MDGVTARDLSLAPPPPWPPANPRRRRVLIAVAVAWGLLLAATGLWYSFHGRPTAREQTTIAQAQPTVDQAIENVVRAAGSAVVPAVFGYEKVADCDVTPIRRGSTYARVAWFYTPVGSEPALLDRIVAGLPAGYDANATHSEGGALHTLTADAGNFVAVRGTVAASGLVEIKATTGCRTLGHQPAADPSAPPGTNPLGVTGTWRLHTLPCGLRTLSVTGPVGKPLSTLPRADAVVSTAELYADRTGLAVRTEADVATLTTTSGTCR